MTKLGLESLYYRRWTHILRFVLFNYFKVKNWDIYFHKTRNNDDLILDKLNLECTKHATLYKSAKIFNNS